MQLSELLSLPVAVNLDTANRALNLGRTKGFTLAKQGAYPVPLLRIGKEYRVRRADLLRVLGVEPNCDEAGAATPTSPSETPSTTSAN
ncbi:integrase [Kitasatospora sp. NPDC001574]